MARSRTTRCRLRVGVVFGDVHGSAAISWLVSAGSATPQQEQPSVRLMVSERGWAGPVLDQVSRSGA